MDFNRLVDAIARKMLLQQGLNPDKYSEYEHRVKAYQILELLMTLNVVTMVVPQPNKPATDNPYPANAEQPELPLTISTN